MSKVSNNNGIMKSYCCFTVVLSLVLAVMAVPVYGESVRIPVPEGVYYHRFASLVNGPEAIWTNPAGLGQNKHLSINYIGEYYEGNFLDNWGMAVSGDGIGISYRHLENRLDGMYSEYIFGTGSRLGRDFFWGVSYRYIKEGPADYHKRHFWNAGIIIDKSQKYSIGVLLSNMNRSDFNGEESAMEQLYSFSYTAIRNLLTLSMEISLSSQENLSKADYNYGIDMILSDRIKVYANLEDNKNYQVGFKYLFAGYSCGAQSRNDSNNNHLGTSVYSGVVRKNKR